MNHSAFGEPTGSYPSGGNDGQTGTVIYGEFVCGNPDGEPVLKFEERRQIDALVGRARGTVFRRPAGQFNAFVTDPVKALEICQSALELLQTWRRSDSQRLALSGRFVAGYGNLVIKGDRMSSDWAFRLPTLLASVPQGSLCLMPELYERLASEFSGPLQAIRVRDGARAGSLYLVDTNAHELDGETRKGGFALDGGAGVYTALQLVVQNQSRVIRSSDCPIPIGRHRSCSVIINGETCSRFHGRIEYANNKFRYVDDSRNGSFVLTADGEEVRLHRESIVLIGKGAISPGATISQQKGDVIRYQCQVAKLALSDDGEEDSSAEPSTARLG